MKRIVFFLHYRGGSTLFQHLVSTTPFFALSDEELARYKAERKRKPVPEYYWLPTIPPEECRIKHTNSGGIEDLAKEAELKYGDKPFAISTHIGNWWGNTPSNEIPQPLEGPSPMKWSAKELLQLPPGEWHFVNVLRDGRNLTESLRNLKGGIEEKLNTENPEDYFKALCKAWRNKARVALECSKTVPNYHIIRFEDLISNTVDIMDQMFNLIGFSLDHEICMERANDIKQRKVGKKHTSFKDDTKMNQRWHRWTDHEIDIFKSIANTELVDLGYEEDDLWMAPR